MVKEENQAQRLILQLIQAVIDFLMHISGLKYALQNPSLLYMYISGVGISSFTLSDCQKSCTPDRDKEVPIQNSD